MAVGMVLTAAPRTAPAPAHRMWTWWADTTIGAVPLGPLRPTAFTCTWLLNDFGTGQITLPFDADDSSITPDRALRMWAWRVWAYYGGRPIWCGCPTGVTDTGAVGATYTLTELPGYLNRRLYDVAGGHTYTQVEQTVIANDLAAPVSAVAVNLVTQPGGGFLRDRAYAFLEGTSRAYLLQELANVISGPQYRSEYAAGTPPVCTLRIAYPRVGSTATGLGIQVPGSGVSYQAQWDGDAMRTHTIAVGDVPANSPSTAVKPVLVKDVPQADLPRLDASDDWPGVVLASTLTEKANTSAGQYAQPALQLTAKATTNDPPLGSYGVGDDVTVAIRSPLLPGGYSVVGQLQQITADAVAGTSEWTVAVTLPTPKARRTITGALAQLSAQQQLLFRTSLAAPTTLP